MKLTKLFAHLLVRFLVLAFYNPDTLSAPLYRIRIVYRRGGTPSALSPVGTLAQEMGTMRTGVALQRQPAATQVSCGSA